MGTIYISEESAATTLQRAKYISGKNLPLQYGNGQNISQGRICRLNTATGKIYLSEESAATILQRAKYISGKNLPLKYSNGLNISQGRICRLNTATGKIYLRKNLPLQYSNGQNISQGRTCATIQQRGKYISGKNLPLQQRAKYISGKNLPVQYSDGQNSSQGRICRYNMTCCHTEIEAALADQNEHLILLQYTDAGHSSPRTDPTLAGAWKSSQHSTNCLTPSGPTCFGSLRSVVCPALRPPRWPSG